MREATDSELKKNAIDLEMLTETTLALIDFHGTIHLFDMNVDLVVPEKTTPKGFSMNAEEAKMEAYFGGVAPKGVDEEAAKRFMDRHGCKSGKVQSALALAYAEFIDRSEKAYRLGMAFRNHGGHRATVVQAFFTKAYRLIMEGN